MFIYQRKRDRQHDKFLTTASENTSVILDDVSQLVSLKSNLVHAENFLPKQGDGLLALFFYYV